MIPSGKLFKHFKLRNNLIFIFIPVPCEMYLFNLHLPNVLYFFLCHDTNITSLRKIHPRPAVNELLAQFFPVLTGKHIRIKQYYVFLPVPKFGQIRNFYGTFPLFFLQRYRNHIRAGILSSETHMLYLYTNPGKGYSPGKYAQSLSAMDLRQKDNYSRFRLLLFRRRIPDVDNLM